MTVGRIAARLRGPAETGLDALAACREYGLAAAVLASQGS
jgi:hypothetical protein